MRARLVALWCSVAAALSPASASAASGSGDPAERSATRPVAAGVIAGLSRPGPGSVEQASLRPDVSVIRAVEARAAGRFRTHGGDRSWVERHPVWTGVFVGFAAGFLLTYAVSHEDENALLTPVDSGGPALVWGGLGAGLGALAGWGIGRHTDDAAGPGNTPTQ